MQDLNQCLNTVGGWGGWLPTELNITPIHVNMKASTIKYINEKKKSPGT